MYIYIRFFKKEISFIVNILTYLLFNKCSLYIEQRTLYNVHGTLYTVQGIVNK